ncbi:MAG: glycosyltransferase [Microbacterium sp.]|uniref:glycosyltransferase n=1 Tax=Microbacterium sp. TaxID=51671 RepID=UPI001AC065CB|nr:glycosyltransferase [Microbacterium sp.]MBN9210071.1 glycosyltransferase [Microbacterium sp.]
MTSPAPNDAVELTILMPCLNEAETLEVCIRKAQGFLQRSGIRGEVLISDNGAPTGLRRSPSVSAPASRTPPAADTAPH